MIEKKTIYKTIAWVVGVYILCAIVLYFAGGQQMRMRISDTGPSSNAKETTSEIIPGVTILQPFTVNAEEILGVTFLPTTLGRANDSSLTISIRRPDKILWQTTVSSNVLTDWKPYTINIGEKVAVVPNEALTLVFESDDANPGNAIALTYGKTESLPRTKTPTDIVPARFAWQNGDKLTGALSFSVNGTLSLWLGTHFGQAFAGGLFLIALWGGRCIYCWKHKKKNMSLVVISVFNKYGFLLNQLIKRDFKTKYKRSVLGVLWSFLNPLLTMTVQYLVFSTIFKSSIDNYPIYLLSGVIIFGFNNEVTTLSLTSIVSNARLITKVYVPKYIYPVSRVFSSLVNFLISLLPLFIMLIVTKTPITSSILLLPYGIICLLMFSMGISLALSALMVFFRDIQFLWSVVTMMWMYLTPIFYPDTIIPAEYFALYRLNPLYHFIKFIRTVLIDGVSPPPYLYAYCMLFALISLICGAWIFKKTQDKFILYL